MLLTESGTSISVTYLLISSGIVASVMIFTFFKIYAHFRFALSAKRISHSDIDAALEEIDTERADSKLIKLMEHKWKSLEGDPQAKLKLLKYALSRGYGYDQVKDIADRITSQSVSDDI